MTTEWFGGATAETMEILSLRDLTRGDATAAYVMVDDVFECHSIEDVVREPKEGRPIGDWAALERWVRSWKLPGITAIPTGRYPVTIDKSTRFKKLMVHILNVPGFDGIRMHAGLKPEDSEGCVLVGDQLYDTPAGPRVKSGTTRPAAERLYEKIHAALDNGVKVWWTFKQNPAA